MFEDDFLPDMVALERALTYLTAETIPSSVLDLPISWPDQETASAEIVEKLAPLVLGAAARLDQPHSMAQMDPPTPWLT